MRPNSAQSRHGRRHGSVIADAPAKVRQANPSALRLELVRRAHLVGGVGERFATSNAAKRPRGPARRWPAPARAPFP
jgi:hypothetical protein